MPKVEARKRLFIASSAEALNVARSIQLQMDRYAQTEVWTDGTFRPTDYYSESLERQLEVADCGVFILTADDLISSRGVDSPAPRDNVILELGMFTGRLGRARTVILHPRENRPKLPTDLHGVVTLDYELDSDIGSVRTEDLTAGLAPACIRLADHLRSLTPRSQYVSWEKTCSLVRSLARDLRAKPKEGGYSFDFILGISHGGIVVADLLSMMSNRVPTMALWPECDDLDCDEFSFAPMNNWVNQGLPAVLQDSRVNRILIVDDLAGRGITLKRAKDAIVAIAPGKTVKTAALISSTRMEEPVDYTAMQADRRIETPFRLILH